jgi:hypothetical protein
MTIVRLDDRPDWRPFDIPDSTPSVSMVSLRAEKETRALSLFVRFPPGWQRPVTGYYEAAEDVLFLSGELEMDGLTYRAGDYAYIPAGKSRAGSSANGEVIALAKFCGPARWHQGAGDPSETALHLGIDSIEATEPSPLGAGRARVLRAGAAWIVETVDAGAPSPIDCELFSLGERAWTWAGKGEPLPDYSGPCFCRVER